MKNFILIFMLITIPAFTLFADHEEIIAGAGPSTAIVNLLAEELGEKHNIVVPPESIKHAGGLKWVADGNGTFGRTGRPMNAKEKAEYPQLRELFLASLKIGFVVNKDSGTSKITLEQLEKIMTKEITNWKEVGGNDKRIILLGRETGEALYSELSEVYPFMKNVKFVKNFKKDPLMIAGVIENSGSIGFGSKPNFVGEDDIIILDIKNFRAGVKVGLVYDVKTERNDFVQDVKKYIGSSKWRSIRSANDLLPPK